MTKKIWKSDFYKNKKVIKIDDIDIDNILVSKEEPYGTKNSLKYFIGYNVIRPSCVRFPQMTGYAKKLEFNLTMSFRISNKQLLKRYYQMWKRIEKILEIKFDCKPVYGDDEKYIKTKISDSDSVITNFQCQKKKLHASVYQ